MSSRCKGRCVCHHCCIPYEGEDGPHCDDCDPAPKMPESVKDSQARKVVMVILWALLALAMLVSIGGVAETLREVFDPQPVAHVYVCPDGSKTRSRCR